MNGIYDFEQNRPPHLDTSMIIERKEKRDNRRLIVLAGIVSFLMMVLITYIGIILFKANAIIYAAIIFGVILYTLIGAFVVGKFLNDNKSDCEENII